MVLDTKVAVLPVAWKCAALNANHGANDPPECYWPYCGCDPHFERVVVGLQECGWTVEPPRNSSQRDPNCEACHGTGEYFDHADDCNDDLCALNGDMYSCVGELVKCTCVAPAPLADEPSASQKMRDAGFTQKARITSDWHDPDFFEPGQNGGSHDE